MLPLANVAALDFAAEVIVGSDAPAPPSLEQFRRVVRPAFSPRPLPLPTNVAQSPTSALAAHAGRRPALRDRLEGLLSSSIAPATLRSYRRVQACFEAFCVSRGFPHPEFTSASVMEYLVHLQDERVGVAFVCALKPALCLQLKFQLRLPSSVFSPVVDTAIVGLKRIAAARRPEVRKMRPLSGPDLLLLFNVLVQPYLPVIALIPLQNIRTMFRASLTFYTFCRFRDFNALRVRHFSPLPSGAVMVYFPEAKNDQLHQGNSTPLPCSAPFPDPVYITKLFFERAGFVLAENSVDSSFVNIVIDPKSKAVVPGRRLSYSRALADLKAACDLAGIGGVAIGEKSAKVGGVTTALASSVSLVDLAAHGRWRTTDIVLHYRADSVAHKVAVADAAFAVGQSASTVQDATRSASAPQ